MMKQHKLWIITLSCALFILLTTPLMTNHLTESVKNDLDSLRTRKQERLSQIRQWESDAITATEIKETMKSVDVRRYLAPAHRSAMAERLELLASASMLYGFTFTLAPAQKWSGNAAFPNFSDVTASNLTFHAAAPNTKALYRFLSFMTGRNSHLVINEIKIKRAQRKTISLRNLMIDAKITWLMNQEKRRHK